MRVIWVALSVVWLVALMALLIAICAVTPVLTTLWCVVALVWMWWLLRSYPHPLSLSWLLVLYLHSPMLLPIWIMDQLIKLATWNLKPSR